MEALEMELVNLVHDLNRKDMILTPGSQYKNWTSGKPVTIERVTYNEIMQFSVVEYRKKITEGHSKTFIKPEYVFKHTYVNV